MRECDCPTDTQQCVHRGGITLRRHVSPRGWEIEFIDAAYRDAPEIIRVPRHVADAEQCVAELWDDALASFLYHGCRPVPNIVTDWEDVCWVDPARAELESQAWFSELKASLRLNG